GDGLALDRLVVVGAQLAGRLGAAFVLGHDAERQAEERADGDRLGALRQEWTEQHRCFLRLAFHSPWRAVSSSLGCSQLSSTMANSSTTPLMMFCTSLLMSMMVKALNSVPIRAQPTTTLNTPPRPPTRLMPPSTTTRITSKM